MIVINRLQTVRRLTHSNVQYNVDIESPRAASRKVRVTFRRNFEDRTAREDGRSRYMLEVSDGQYERFRAADQVKLPKSLEQPMADAVENICAYEHSLAVAAGTLPIDPERFEFYKGHVGHWDTTLVRNADAVLASFGGVLGTPDMISVVIDLAKNFIPNEVHEDKLEAAADERRKIQEKYEDLLSRSDEAIRSKANAEQAIADWEATASELLEVGARLRNRDLIGTYGSDDFERTLDLMQPVLERCHLI